MTQASSLCPCGSGLAVKDCCKPFIQGKSQVATAEQLLRARYTAFALGDIDYIIQTHHSKTVHEIKREEVQEWSASSEWLGLKIVQSEAGTVADTQGSIVFCANFRTRGEEKIQEHWEQSLFEKENGEWKFLDARGIQNGPLRREGPKVGRNDPCSCGSGKKFKKCHGK